ncbi:MAG: hypothetical protein H0U44_07020 [Flavisolibacter sp.]|jgi:hypothetical protein|nr:hypothetical protein [Flavisolibacter sp.]
MKSSLLLLFILSFVSIESFSQECKLRKSIDQFSQEPKLSSGFMNFSTVKGERISLSIEADSKEVRLLFSLKGNCFNDQSTAAFSFEGSKSKNTQKNTSSMNCDGVFTIVFRNTNTTPSALQKIGKQKLTTILFTSSNNQKIEVQLTEDERALVVEKANCMITESKSLIKS